VVASCIKNAALQGRRVEFVVADDSGQELVRERNMAVLGDLTARFGIDIWYAGPREKTQFARHLANLCGVSPALVEFALFGAAGWPPAPGANRNALLLHTAGDALLMLDDDMICKVARLPAGENGLTLTSTGDPTEFWFYPSAEAALDAAEFVEEDFLAAHESLLGHNVGRLASERDPRSGIDLDQVSSHFLKNLEPDGGIVTYTMAGVLGDSGLKESLPFFFVEGPSLERLLSAQHGHRGAMANRQMARGVRRTTISDTEFCMGANIGLDNRALLPPFQTAARNEDGIFSALVKHCIPGSFIGFLPRTVLHAPVRRRVFPVDRFHETVGVLEAADTILHLIWSWPEPPGRSTVARRMASLGAFLGELGALPPPDFEARLRDVCLTICSSEAAFIERALREHGSKQPRTWAADLRRYLDALRERLEADQAVTLRELEDRPPEAARRELQRFLADYGRLLSSWPELVEGAKQLRQRGTRLARRL